MTASAKLTFFCGKMAAGKSTLARELALRENTVHLVQDEFLAALFPGEITDIQGFVKCFSRLQNALTLHVCALLSKGISVEALKTKIPKSFVPIFKTKYLK
jgi:predicted kinase